MTLEFSLREHKVYGAYSPAFTFSKASGTILRQTTPNSSLGRGYFFVTVPRAWLDGKYIRWRWQGYASLSREIFHAYIYDGAYDRSSDVDFPSGASLLIKGNGLLQTLDINGATFGMETKDVQANVAGGSETDCTIFFALSDAWGAWNFWLQLDWFELNTGAGGAGPLYDEQFTDSVHMEKTGTTGDYGYISTGVVVGIEDGSAELYAKVLVQHPSEELYAHAIIRNVSSAELYAHAEIRHPASAEVYAHVVIQSSEDLYAKFKLTTVPFSLREHKSYAGLNPNYVYTKSSASVLRMSSVSVAFGDGYFFFVVDRKWLNGKYIRFRWRSDLFISFYVQAIIRDGAYNRASDVDFPSGAPILSKGNGLLQTLAWRNAGAFGWETIDVQAALDAGSEDNCTVMFMMHDNQSGYAPRYLDIDWLEISSGAGGAGRFNLEPFNAAVVMERTGTFGDYGYISGGFPPLAGSEALYSHVIITIPDSEELYAHAEIRQPASAEIYASFVVQTALPGSAELYAHAIIRNIGSAEVYGIAEIRQPSEELYAHVIIRHPDSAELYGLTEIRNIDSAELYASFEAQVSLNLYAHAIIRQPASAEIYGTAEIRNIGSAEVYSHAIIRQLTSVELYAHTVIKNIAFTEVYGHAKIRHPGTPVELYAHAIIRQPTSVELYGHAIIRNISSVETYAHLVVRQPASVELYGHAEVQQLTSVELYAHAIIKNTASAEAYAHAIIKTADSAEIYGHAEIQHPDSADLYALFIIRQPASADLYASFEAQTSLNLYAHAIIRNISSAELLGKFIIRKSSFANPYCHVIVRNIGSAELYGLVEIQHPDSADLYALFIVRQPASAEIYGTAEIRNIDSGEVYAHAIIRQPASADLYAHTVIKNIASAEAYAHLVIRQPTFLELYGHAEIRHPDLSEIYAHAIIRNIDSAEAYAHFIVKNISFVELYGHAEIRQPASVELYARTKIRHPGVPVELYGYGIIRNIDSAELYAHAVIKNIDFVEVYSRAKIRHPGIPVELYAHVIIRHPASEDVYAHTIIKNIDSADAYAHFIVRNLSFAELYASFSAQVSLNLLVKFVVRHPYRLWTNRRYLNGVVELDEENLGDALLEYVIEGVMNDIKSRLIREDLTGYVSWTDITKTPKLIRRATTYATVATLYARDNNNPLRRIVLGIRPLAARVVQEREAQERAMDYWEEKFEKTLALFATSQSKKRMIVDTADEEPVFSMEELPFSTEDPYYIKSR